MINKKTTDQRSETNRKPDHETTDEEGGDQPLVSVIIPTLERPKFLQQALKSVRKQTYSPIEIIVISDPSEAVKEVVEDAKSRMTAEIVHLINKKKGVSTARNQGINVASGTYIAFLDDDDIWHPEKTREQVQSMTTTGQPVAAVYCGRQTFTLDWEYRHSRHPTADGDLFEELLVRNMIGSPSMVLVRTDAVRDIGGFDPSMRYHEDWEFYLRLSRDYRWACQQTPLLTRIAHPDARSRDTEAKLEARLRIIDRYRTELEERCLYDEAMNLCYLEAGIDYCKAGDRCEGRRLFRVALRERVTLLGVVLYLSTFLGLTGFRALSWVNRMITTVRQRGSTRKIPLDKSDRVDTN